MSDEAVRVMMIGVEPKAALVVQSICENGKFFTINTAEDFGNDFEQWNDDTFSAIICGPYVEGLSPSEMAQVLVNQCPGTIKYYLTFDTTKYEPRILLKNGFTNAFVLPMDAPLLKKIMTENILFAKKKERSFRSVRVLDIAPGDQLDFDTFLYFPLNKKYIRYTSSETAVDPAKIEKLQTRSMSQLYVDHRDMSKFYQYSAKKLRELGEGGVSSTERQEKLKDCVRTLFSDIFDQSVKADFEQGREMIKQCESIISNYITKGASSAWYKKLMTSIGESEDTYNHASNVSTFAALFAIGMGHKRPEDLAMAGLFHDLGLTQLPEELQGKNEEDLKDSEKELYYSHVEKSLAMIKTKRIIIPEAVEKAIIQHHERFAGKGWPKKLSGSRISEEAGILSFADQFDYLTRFEQGKPRLGPMEALERIRSNGSVNPDIVSQIRRLLEKESGLFKTA